MTPPDEGPTATNPGHTNRVRLEPVERHGEPTPSLGFVAEPTGHTRYFEDDYWRLSDWSCSATGMIAAELDFLQGLVNQRGIHSVYDAGCGRGRHLVPLLDAGLDAFGVDISVANVAAARRLLHQHGHHDLRAESGDIAVHRVPHPVDLTISMLPSFGYGDDHHNLAVLRRLRGNTRTGGLLLMDLPNREQLVVNFLQRTWAEVGGYHYLMHYDFDLHTGMRDSWLRVIPPDGAVRSYHHRVRTYTTCELAAMLTSAGFGLVDVVGDFSNTMVDFDRDSRRLQYLAEAI